VAEFLCTLQGRAVSDLEILAHMHGAPSTRAQCLRNLRAQVRRGLDPADPVAVRAVYESVTPAVQYGLRNAMYGLLEATNTPRGEEWAFLAPRAVGRPRKPPVVDPDALEAFGAWLIAGGYKAATVTLTLRYLQRWVRVLRGEDEFPTVSSPEHVANLERTLNAYGDWLLERATLEGAPVPHVAEELGAFVEPLLPATVEILRWAFRKLAPRKALALTWAAVQVTTYPDGGPQRIEILASRRLTMPPDLFAWYAAHATWACPTSPDDPLFPVARRSRVPLRPALVHRLLAKAHGNVAGPSGLVGAGPSAGPVEVLPGPVGVLPGPVGLPVEAMALPGGERRVDDYARLLEADLDDFTRALRGVAEQADVRAPLLQADRLKAEQADRLKAEQVDD